MTIQSIIREVAINSNPFKKGQVLSRCEQQGVSVSQSKFERATQELNCTKPKRGWYLLPVDTTTEEVTVEEVTVEDVTVEEVKVEEVTVEEPVVNNTWIPVLDQVDGEMFQEDMSSTPDHLSLKDIALVGQKCFGKYYPDNICGSCPLKGTCQTATYAKIELWAQELMNEELAVVEEQVEVTEGTTDEQVTDGEQVISSKQTLSVGFDTICSKCREVIPAGTSFINQVGVGNIHTQCV